MSPELAIFEKRPIPFWQYVAGVCMFCVCLTGCIILLMWGDYILRLAKSHQVPQIYNAHVDYQHITKSEVTVVSGVTKEVE